MLQRHACGCHGRNGGVVIVVSPGSKPESIWFWTAHSGAGRVGDAFVAAAVERAGDWTWCRLRPKAEASDFEQVSLAFDARGELAAMELRDKLGQATVIEFGAVRRNPSLDAALFRFEPPPGADVIGRAGP